MKPVVLNKVKDENCIIILYTFKECKDVTFFNIYTNNFSAEQNEILTETLNKVRNSGFDIFETKHHKVNFPEGKIFNIEIKFVLWKDDVRKVYDRIKSLFEYGNC